MRKLMKLYYSMFAALLLVLGMGAVQAQAEEMEDPYKLIQRVAETTFKRIAADKQLIEKDPNHLKNVVREELMPYIHYKFAAHVVLGRVDASQQEKEAFYEAFKGYLITTYATVFTKYTDQKVVFEAPRSIEDKKVVTVKTRITDSVRPDIHIDFKVRLNKKTGEWRAYDMVAEGISLLNSKKAELKAMLRQKDGIAKVTEILNEKAQLNNGEIALVGMVDRNTVPVLLKGIELSKFNHEQIVLDFSQVDKVDTAGLAWILKVKAHAEHSGQTLKLNNIPAQLCSLAQLGGVNNLLD